MIFKQEMVDAILAGRKTVTRRPVKFPEHGRYLPCRYEPGKTYAVQTGRGKKGVGRIRVLHVSINFLFGVSRPGEPGREGFEDAAAFTRYWMKLYGDFDPMQPVWRIEFELVSPTTSERSEP